VRRAVDVSREAAELYAAGLSLDDVAEKLGVAYRTARKALSIEGVELRDPSARLVGRTRPDRAVR
jgi:uncharacterized protein YjcR